MRKLRIIEHISLDGVIQHSADDGDFPYSNWTTPYRTPTGRDALTAALGEHGDILRAVESRHPGRAAQAMRTHLRHVVPGLSVALALKPEYVRAG